MSIESAVERIMKRQHAASGTAVFLDPVILRQILDEELADTHERTRQAAARWRETADIWEQQNEASYSPSAPGEPQPPSRSRAVIGNWINWLRSCASQIDPPPSEPTKERP